MTQVVWILYCNEPGCSGRVVGTFSTPEKAMKCKAIRGQVGFAQWEPRQNYWVCNPDNKDFYFSVEPSMIDRLDEE